VFHKLFYRWQYISAAIGCADLQREPFVDDQRFVLEQRIETLQRFGCQR
jgi:hypothetical protein